VIFAVSAREGASRREREAKQEKSKRIKGMLEANFIARITVTA